MRKDFVPLDVDGPRKGNRGQKWRAPQHRTPVQIAASRPRQEREQSRRQLQLGEGDQDASRERGDGVHRKDEEEDRSSPCRAQVRYCREKTQPQSQEGMKIEKRRDGEAGQACSA